MKNSKPCIALFVNIIDHLIKHITDKRHYQYKRLILVSLIVSMHGNLSAQVIFALHTVNHGSEGSATTKTLEQREGTWYVNSGGTLTEVEVLQFIPPSLQRQRQRQRQQRLNGNIPYCVTQRLPTSSSSTDGSTLFASAAQLGFASAEQPEMSYPENALPLIITRVPGLQSDLLAVMENMTVSESAATDTYQATLLCQLPANPIQKQFPDKNLKYGVD